MKIQSWSFVSVACACTALLFTSAMQATQLQAAERPGAYRAFVSNVEPDHHRLDLVSRAPLVVSGLTAGVVAVYDDPATARPSDYFELYDNDGDLVAVGWFDRFGIRRMAVDRGLLKEQRDLEGVLVTLLQGDSI